MPTPMTPLQTELIEEEIDQLFHIANRHVRWANKTDDFDDARTHRQIAQEINSLCIMINSVFFGSYQPRYRRQTPDDTEG
jgi:hypothetical protein